MKISYLFAIAFFVCLFVIEFLATTTLEIKPIENSWDKANHFIAFFTLYVTLSLGYSKLEIFKKVVLLLAFGLQIEIVQYFLPNREFSLLDVVADGVGIVFGLVVAKAFWYVMDTKMSDKTQ